MRHGPAWSLASQRSLTAQSIDRYDRRALALALVIEAAAAGQAAGPLARGLATHAPLGIDVIELGKGGGQTNPPIDRDRFRNGDTNVARTPSNTRPRMPIKGQTTDAASI
jgi:hypothetical protein